MLTPITGVKRSCVMNGLSDVRLTLHGPQLEAEHEAVKDVFQPRSAPAGLGRWGLFAHRFNTRRVLRSIQSALDRNICSSPPLRK